MALSPEEKMRDAAKDGRFCISAEKVVGTSERSDRSDRSDRSGKGSGGDAARDEYKAGGRVMLRREEK